MQFHLLDDGGCRLLEVVDSCLDHSCPYAVNLDGHRQPSLSTRALVQSGLATTVAPGLKHGHLKSTLQSVVAVSTGLKVSKSVSHAALRCARSLIQGDPYDFR